MIQKFDRKSLRKLKEAVKSILPQSSPRAVKALDDLKEAVKRMERENKTK